MQKDSLIRILGILRDLNSQLYLASRTRDKRRIDKRIRNAKTAISDYANGLPDELKVFLEGVVGANPMSYQHTDDIGQCIREIEALIANAEGQNILL